MTTRRRTAHPLSETQSSRLTLGYHRNSRSGGLCRALGPYVEPSQHALGPRCVETQGATVLGKKTGFLLTHNLRPRSCQLFEDSMSAFAYCSMAGGISCQTNFLVHSLLGKLCLIEFPRHLVQKSHLLSKCTEAQDTLHKNANMQQLASRSPFLKCVVSI